jgi:hypothetical protein
MRCNELVKNNIPQDYYNIVSHIEKILPTEREEAVLLFIRDGSESQVDEDEEYARVYLEMRGPDRWFTSAASRQLESIKRSLFPLYLVPVPNRSGYWVLDSTKAISITSFDDFNPSMLVAQLSYLVNNERTALDFTGESGQAIFDHISGALLNYSRLQDDYNQDLSSALSKEFLIKEYANFVEAAKPLVGGSGPRLSPYKVAISERINPAYSWDEAFRLLETIEKRVSFLTDYLHRCSDSTGRLYIRAQEFEKHVTFCKDKLAREFDDFKALKGREEAGVIEQRDSDKQGVEKTYRPLLSKAEKQLKSATEANEAAQIELMPVQSVYDEMHTAASKLQDLIDQSNASRDETARKTDEFRTKYIKLQEDQSNIQARSTKTAEEKKSVPEDTPLDAEMAYLERQALGYESKAQQLDEELKKLSDEQARGNAELEKFETSYRPIKEKADEAKASFEKRKAELEELNQQKDSEIDAIEGKCQGELSRLRSEVEEAEAVLGYRLPSIDKSFEGLKSSMDRLKVTLASAQKYADENIQHSLEAMTLSGGDLSKVMHYPFYVGTGLGLPEPIFIMGRTSRSSNEPSSTVTLNDGSMSSPGAIDIYIQSRLPSFQWNAPAGDFDLFSQMEFKGRLIAGFKQLAKKGLITESRMLKLAKEVAIIDLSLS